jgi:hypothetical protein
MKPDVTKYDAKFYAMVNHTSAAHIVLPFVVDLLFPPPPVEIKVRLILVVVRGHGSPFYHHWALVK